MTGDDDGGGGDGEGSQAGGDDDEPPSPSCSDYIMHFLTLFWKIIFAFIPPTGKFYIKLLLWLNSKNGRCMLSRFTCIQRKSIWRCFGILDWILKILNKLKWKIVYNILYKHLNIFTIYFLLNPNFLNIF